MRFCHSFHHSLSFVGFAITYFSPCVLTADFYYGPTGYYDTATGTGLELKNQLTSIMSAGHILRTYGDLRFSAAIEDSDPNHPGSKLLVYNRASVPSTWDYGTTWIREHICPVSLQGGSDPSNSTTGHRADPNALRPAHGGQASYSLLITNLNANGASEFADNLDIDSIVGSVDTGVLLTGLTPFAGLMQGDWDEFDSFFIPTTAGQFSATYTVNLSDEDLPGEQTQLLTLNLTAEAYLAGDFNVDGVVDAADYSAWRDGLGSVYTLDDYELWKTHFGDLASPGMAGLSKVPEPPMGWLPLAGLVCTLFFDIASGRRNWERRIACNCCRNYTVSTRAASG